MNNLRKVFDDFEARLSGGFISTSSPGSQTSELLAGKDMFFTPQFSY